MTQFGHNISQVACCNLWLDFFGHDAVQVYRNDQMQDRRSLGSTMPAHRDFEVRGDARAIPGTSCIEDASVPHNSADPLSSAVATAGTGKSADLEMNMFYMVTMLFCRHCE